MAEGIPVVSTLPPKHQKFITGIAIGAVQGKVAWVFQYQPGSCNSCGCAVAQESYSLDAATARQFIQGLQEQLLALDNSPAPPLEGTQSGVWMGDHAVVRLQPPPEEE